MANSWRFVLMSAVVIISIAAAGSGCVSVDVSNDVDADGHGELRKLRMPNGAAATNVVYSPFTDAFVYSLTDPQPRFAAVGVGGRPTQFRSALAKAIGVSPWRDEAIEINTVGLTRVSLSGFAEIDGCRFPNDLRLQEFLAALPIEPGEWLLVPNSGPLWRVSSGAWDFQRVIVPDGGYIRGASRGRDSSEVALIRAPRTLIVLDHRSGAVRESRELAVRELGYGVATLADSYAVATNDHSGDVLIVDSLTLVETDRIRFGVAGNTRVASTTDGNFVAAVTCVSVGGGKFRVYARVARVESGSATVVAETQISSGFRVSNIAIGGTPMRVSFVGPETYVWDLAEARQSSGTSVPSAE